MEQRIYPLKPGQGYFEVGVAGGKQLLFDTTVHHIRLHWFTPDGELLSFERWRMAVTPPQFPGSQIYQTDAVYWQSVEEEVEALKPRIGFAPCEIRVGRFETEESSIEDLPGEYDEYLSGDAPAIDEDDRQFLEEEIRRWRESGSFVWDSGFEQYYIDASGVVVSHT